MLLMLGNHRAQAQFDRAKWRLMVLLPFWVLQLALTMTMVGLFAWRLGDTMKTYEDQDKHGKAPTIEVVWEATNIGLAFVATVCTFIEIIKYFAEALTPWSMLFTHVIKMTCAMAILALDVVVYIERHDRHYSLVGLGLDGAFIITACALVIYSIRTFRRLSKYDDYAHPVNVKPFGFNDDLERDTSYNSNSVGSRPSLDKRLSSASSLLSLGSIRSVQKPVQLQQVERTPSQYSHKRDTQFDAYVARHGSVRSNRDGERTMSGDYSWSGTPVDEEPNRRDNLSPASRARALSAPRAPSYASERGLVAVPEEEDEHERGDDRRYRDSLVGDSRRESMEQRSIDQPAVPQEADISEPRWRRE